MRGFISRSRCCTKSVPNRPFTHVDPLLGVFSSIQGDLTLRGVTHPVEITGTVTGPLENAYGQQRLGFDVETTVNRQEYGLSWNMELPGGGQALGDDVIITANLALVQA